MKKVFVSFGIVFIMITIALFYLVKRGVSVRPQPLIKPTELDAKFQPVGQHLFLRMFPEFQFAEVVVWKLNFSDWENEKVLSDVALDWEKNFGNKPKILAVSQQQQCLPQCWLVLRPGESSDLTKAKWVEINGIRISKIQEKISETCENQKIMTEECLTEVIPYLVRKRIKKYLKPTFFMHKYLDQSFYLFVYDPQSLPAKN